MKSHIRRCRVLIPFLLVVFVACAAVQERGYPRNQALYVTMRDGVEIAIDVWLPEKLEPGDVIYPDRSEEDKKLLTYTSAPMGRDVEITGHPLITLYVTSTTTDGAFIAYLEDVAPDGRVTYITEGQLRGVMRRVTDEPPPYKKAGPHRTELRADTMPLVPGEVAEITFELWATSVLIKKDHRIRVAVAGADKHSVGNMVMGEVGGRTFRARVNEVGVEKISLDLNHPLAGKTLDFAVEVLEVQKQSE